jgi:hypothetical protein
VTTTTREDSVDGGDAIGRRLDLNIVNGFQQTGRGLMGELTTANDQAFSLRGGRTNSRLVERWG